MVRRGKNSAGMLGLMITLQSNLREDHGHRCLDLTSDTDRQPSFARGLSTGKPRKAIDSSMVDPSERFLEGMIKIDHLK